LRTNIFILQTSKTFNYFYYFLKIIMFSLQAPGLDFDENGLPKIPGTPQGCSVM
jgi:hypothetical protein